MSEILKDFIENNEITIQKILNNLLNGDKNLDLKTHIYKPKQLASLFTLAKHLKNQKYNGASKLIMDFIETYLRYMVSFKRESRKEIIKALSNLKDDSESLNKLNSSFK